MNPRQPTEKSTPYQEIIQGVINISREISGQGFEDVEESEILDLVLPEDKKLSLPILMFQFGNKAIIGQIRAK